jgi:hypothetical protein
MACNTTFSTSEILAVELLPDVEMKPWITECFCRSVYGAGSADLTGVGVSKHRLDLRFSGADIGFEFHC